MCLTLFLWLVKADREKAKRWVQATVKQESASPSQGTCFGFIISRSVGHSEEQVHHAINTKINKYCAITFVLNGKMTGQQLRRTVEEMIHLNLWQSEFTESPLIAFKNDSWQDRSEESMAIFYTHQSLQVFLQCHPQYPAQPMKTRDKYNILQQFCCFLNGSSQL